MKIEEFNCLAETKKEEMIFNAGDFLGTDTIDNTVFDIYRLDEFYVQFSYEMSKNERAKIVAFRNPHEIFFFNKLGVPDIV